MNVSRKVRSAMTERYYFWVVSYLSGKQAPMLGEYKTKINKSELSPDMYDLFKNEISENTGIPTDEIVLLSVMNFGECNET
jgi:hypothetical protein